MDQTIRKMDTPTIYRDMHDRLVSTEFKPGQKLKSDDLRQLYGCSASTIREVMLRLSSVGLVTFEDQRGFRVSNLSDDRRDDLTRFRILLEQEGASLSMQHGGLEWEAQLTAAHHKLRHIEGKLAQTGDVEDSLAIWSSADWEFHETLISACKSPLLRKTYQTIYNQFRQQLVSQRSSFSPAYFHMIIAEHQDILDAALSRNAKTCHAAIYDHLKRNFAYGA